MRTFLGVGLVLACACGPSRALPGRRVASRADAIVNGRVSYEDVSIFELLMEYPDATYICSSTLITPHTLLTAAHCVVPDDSGNRPVVSATNAVYDGARGVRWYDAAHAKNHAGYHSATITNDVAVVVLTEEPHVPTKPFNRATLDSSLAGQRTRVVGYGITDLSLDDSGLRRTGFTKLKEVREQQFDYGETGLNRSGVCEGDSGGPSFFTFPDGVERQIGIHSSHSGDCGANTDTRVDAYASWIDAQLAAFDVGECVADGRCRADCATVDPDCACLEDGVCGASCTFDPDCASTCAEDGVCSNTACATPDPDCSALGETCGRAAHCGSRLCISTPQRSSPYCSQTCDAATPCSGGLTCVSGRCEWPQLPAVAEGGACVPGQSWCDDPSLVCAGSSLSPDPVCALHCYEDADCGPARACVKSLTVGVKRCVDDIKVPLVTTLDLKAPKGCAVVGGLWPMAALLLARRRRRR